jgi:hypothetical protein
MRSHFGTGSFLEGDQEQGDNDAFPQFLIFYGFRTLGKKLRNINRRQ